MERDRFGLARHRWEAANLQNDPNITTRDVPTKFGDDATDSAKFYLATFAMTAAPLTARERRNLEMPENLREENAPPLGDSWKRDGWELGRIAWMETAKRRKSREHSHWSHEVIDPNDDAWNQVSPFAGTEDDPWKGSD